jgi:predicted LPLAT superfamily acyltransferase
MTEAKSSDRRNPGPSWGYAFIYLVNRLLPWPIMKWVLRMSSLVSLCLMKEQRHFSKKFLGDILDHEPTWRDSWKHFTAFSEFLVRRFDAASGTDPVFYTGHESQVELEKMARSGEQAFHGTFHFGNSDLMGFWLSRFDLTIRMIRYQVGNSNDLKWLEKRFGDQVGFLWVNKPEDFLFSLKGAIDEGHCIAMKCDRSEHSSKLEPFPFFGKVRWFPFTIYHLSVLFNLPVAFSFGIPEGQHGTRVYSSTIYRPIGESKSDKLKLARKHFRETLEMLEGLVQEHPYQWFNFLDANPVVDETEVRALAQ